MLSQGVNGFYGPDIKQSQGVRGQVEICASKRGCLHVFGKHLVLLRIRDKARWPLDSASCDGGAGNALRSLGLCAALCRKSISLTCSSSVSLSQDKL